MKVAGLGQCSLDNLFIVDSFPVPDTKKEVIEWTIAGGGPAATALAALSRLGMDCSFYGITGDDEAGRKITDSLRLENIDISGLLKRHLSDSQVAFIAIEKKSGKRTIFWKRPSAEPLKLDELPDDFLDGTDFLLVDGLMAEASIYAAEKARAENIPVMLDAGRVRKGMIELAHLCDYVVGSEEFARELMNNGNSFEPEKTIMRMKSFGAKAVTITLGDKGSITASGNEVFQTPAFKVDVVDTTGAGDVFHGGYIYGLLQKWDIKNVVRFASAFAALKCKKLGGRAGIPTLEEVENLLTD
ncbi:5-dehydro-2-deoxygluconokinase [bacterium BMS3Abin06]|nr:5-dehydro-2-deoxygluconokinase [bacterium BMS3Abin06]